MDCLILTIAEAEGAPLVTFDAELLNNGAITPEDYLNR